MGQIDLSGRRRQSLASIVGRAFQFELVGLVTRASWQVRC